jgi:hypothetical protein
MTRGVKAGLGAVAGYVVAAPLGYGLVTQLSSNTHDPGVEAAMTAAFVLGPAGAVVGLLAGLLHGRAAATTSRPDA